MAPDNPYQGINATFMDVVGQAFEVQFHTPASAQARGKSHGAYKAMQSLAARGEALAAKGEALRDKDRQKLAQQRAKSAEAWRAVQAPANADQIAASQADPQVWAEYREKLGRRLAL